MLNVFSVFDTKAETYSRPFFAITTAVALREFEQVCNDPSTSIGAHPEDYNLFYLGSFDEHTAEFDLGVPTSLGNAQHLVRQDKIFEHVKPEESNGSPLNV